MLRLSTNGKNTTVSCVYISNGIALKFLKILINNSIPLAEASKVMPEQNNTANTTTSANLDEGFLETEQNANNSGHRYDTDVSGDEHDEDETERLSFLQTSEEVQNSIWESQVLSPKSKTKTASKLAQQIRQERTAIQSNEAADEVSKMEEFAKYTVMLRTLVGTTKHQWFLPLLALCGGLAWCNDWLQCWMVIMLLSVCCYSRLRRFVFRALVCILPRNDTTEFSASKICMTVLGL